MKGGTRFRSGPLPAPSSDRPQFSFSVSAQDSELAEREAAEISVQWRGSLASGLDKIGPVITCVSQRGTLPGHVGFRLSSREHPFFFYFFLFLFLVFFVVRLFGPFSTRFFFILRSPISVSPSDFELTLRTTPSTNPNEHPPFGQEVSGSFLPSAIHYESITSRYNRGVYRRVVQRLRGGRMLHGIRTTVLNA